MSIASFSHSAIKVKVEVKAKVQVPPPDILVAIFRSAFSENVKYPLLRIRPATD